MSAEFKTEFHYFTAVWPQKYFWATLCLSFPTCEMKVRAVYHRVVIRMTWKSICKALSSAHTVSVRSQHYGKLASLIPISMSLLWMFNTLYPVSNSLWGRQTTQHPSPHSLQHRAQQLPAVGPVCCFLYVQSSSHSKSIR